MKKTKSSKKIVLKITMSMTVCRQALAFHPGAMAVSLSYRKRSGQSSMVCVRNMVFLKLFLVIFTTFYVVSSPPHSFLSVSLFKEMTRRVLLISRRS